MLKIGRALPSLSLPILRMAQRETEGTAERHSGPRDGAPTAPLMESGATAVGLVFQYEWATEPSLAGF